MPEIFVKLRSDLEIRPESSASDSPVVVKDPLVRRFYRFTPVQAAVLRRLDGKQELSSIAQLVSQECQTEVHAGQLESFVEKLQSLLLLDHPTAWSKLEELSKSKKKWSSILSIKVQAFNPDALLARMEKRLRFCFSRWFVGVMLLSILLAAIVSILNWEDLFLSFGTLLNRYSIPLIVLLAFVVMTIHEFAHGLTLKHFGGRVEEMGFLLLYFIPGFYCNVSDAWMLKKRERVWVTLAGGFVQLFLGALAVIAWRLLSPETFLSRVCLVTIAFSGLHTLFNFNPLIKLDGYYLLSDYLNVPNLRPKAFGFLKQKLIRWLWGRLTAPQVLIPDKRERRIYWRYGIASLLFSAGLLWIMVQRIGGWLVDRYQMWGILLISAIGLFSMQATAKETPLTTGKFLNGIAARVRRPLGMWLVLGLILGGTLLPWELKVSGDFTVRSVLRVSVNSQVDGTLKGIYVDEGKGVQRGDLLAEMENLELKNEYEETKGELATKAALLNLLKAGSRPEEIEKARKQVDTKKAELDSALRVEQERTLLQATVAKKQAELQNAGDIYARSEQLFQSGLISRNELDRDRTLYEVRQRELSEARSQLDVLEEKTAGSGEIKKKAVDESESALNVLLAGSRKESIEVAQAELTKLGEKTRILEQQLEQLRIRSPIDGVVATPYLGNRIGEYLKKGDSLCEVVNLGTMVVDMPVPEKEIADVKVGYPIILKVRGYPALSFWAEVTTISPVAVESGAERKVLIKSQLNNPSGLLKAGMTGVGKILCGERMIAHLLSRRAVRWLRTEFWEYLP